jgi:hypothetical protein
MAFLRLIEGWQILLIVGDGGPLAEVKPILDRDGSLRPYGLAAGRFITPEDFDRPLPTDVIYDFDER